MSTSTAAADLASAPASVAASSAPATVATPFVPPSVVFEGATWHRFCVPPCELRLDITLSNGQCFGWRRVDPQAREQQQQKSGGAKRKRAVVKPEEPPPAAAAASSGAAAADSSAVAVAALPAVDENDDIQVKLEPTDSFSNSFPFLAASASAASSAPAVPPAPSDPHYVGVIGRSIIGIRQTADDILYTEHAFGSGAVATPLHELDAILRDYFHLPSMTLDAATGLPRYSDMLLSHLYPAWCQKATPRFAFLANVYPGVRLLRSEPLECLFSFICSSNNNVPRITQMLEALRREFGERIELPPSVAAAAPYLADQAFYAFPTVDQLCTIQESRLRELGFGYRAKFITTSAALLRDKGGVAYLTALRSQSRSEVERILLEFTGVGPKVAACVALFSLDSLGSIPCDTHIWKVALRDYSELSKLGGIDLHAVKNLNATVMVHVGNVFRSVFGVYAGWAHCLLFLAELPEFKRKLKEMGLDVSHPPVIVKQKKESKAKAKAKPAANVAPAAADSETETESESDDSTVGEEEEQPPSKKPPAKRPKIASKAAGTLSRTFKQAKPVR